MAWNDERFIGKNNSSNGVSTSSVTSNADGSILERLEWVQATLGSAAGQLRTVFSDSEAVEENAIQFFNIGIFDMDAGAIASASIDITSISAVLEKSTGGGAFSSAGITQPTFSKTNGSVYCAYQFLAAEWVTGDMYKLVVSGITATIGGATAYVPSAVWSNIVVETADIDTNVEYIVGVVDDIHTDVGTAISNIGAVAAVVADIHDVDLPDIKSDTGAIITTQATGAGVVQIVQTTESFNQAASSYDLLTGTSQAVILEGFSMKLPTGAAGGALTSVSVQTDDATPGVIISSTLGAVANLTSEAEISWTGCLLVNVGTKIQLTINGGAHGSAYTATFTAKYRAVVAGGTLAA